MNLSVKLFDRKLSNPLFLPSGIINEIPAHKKAVEAGVGTVVLKSITFNKREGNPLPRVIKFESGYINSVGLRNPGYKEGKRQIAKFIKKINTPIIISIFSTRVADFQKMTAELAVLKPFAIELNLSCPNVEDDNGIILATTEDASFAATKVARKEAGNIPIICKLSPNAANISDIAKSCEAAGADAVSAINTLAPGMVIDVKKRQPVLGAKWGGISGPAIKPLAVGKVYEIYEAVQIPILGVGGVSTWQDVVEMILAGATLVGMGSAVYLHGYDLFNKTKRGLRQYMKKNKLKSLSEITGAAH